LSSTGSPLSVFSDTPEAWIVWPDTAMSNG